jgi:hypothetical protein
MLGLYRLEQDDLTRVIAVGPAAPREFVETIASARMLSPVVDTRRGRHHPAGGRQCPTCARWPRAARRRARLDRHHPARRLCDHRGRGNAGGLGLACAAVAFSLGLAGARRRLLPLQSCGDLS